MYTETETRQAPQQAQREPTVRRPLLFVARLPRNTTGKLPQQALRSLAAAHLKSA